MKRFSWFLSSVLFLSCVQASDRVWIGTGECQWSDAKNWQGKLVPAVPYQDTVIFSNTLPASITLPQEIRIASVSVHGEDVEIFGSGDLRLGEGRVDVVRRSQLTFHNSLSGNNTNSITKTGRGTLAFKRYCKDFSGMEVRSGLILVDNGKIGDTVRCGPLIRICDGAKIQALAYNPFENNTTILVEKGGVLDMNRQGDLLGAIVGEGDVLNGYPDAYLLNSLTRHPYGPVKINVLTPTGFRFVSGSTATDGGYVIGTPKGFSQALFLLQTDAAMNPLQFSPEFDTYHLNRITMEKTASLLIQDTNGDPIAVRTALNVGNGAHVSGSGNLILSADNSYLNGSIEGLQGELILDGTRFMVVPDSENRPYTINRVVYSNMAELGTPASFKGCTVSMQSLRPASDTSGLLITMKAQQSELGTDFSVKSAEAPALNEGGFVKAPIFSQVADPLNNTGFLSFLSYHAEKGFVPAEKMIGFQEKTTALPVCVTQQTTLVDGPYAVGGLQLNRYHFNVSTDLKIGNGVDPAFVLVNSIQGSDPLGFYGNGSIDFGNSRGWFVFNCDRWPSDYGNLSCKIEGKNGVVFAGMPQMFSSYDLVRVRNSYTGGTWILGARIKATSPGCLGPDAVYVKGDEIAGGQLMVNLESEPFTNPLYLSGVGVRYGSGNRKGAIFAERPQTIESPIVLEDDATIGALTGIQLYLKGNVSGEGTLSISQGIAILSGTNTFAGGMKILQDAVVSADRIGQLSSGPIEVVGTLQLNNQEALTIPNEITGTGKIELKGTGTVAFQSLEKFSGEVILSDGASIDLLGQQVLWKNVGGKGIVTSSLPGAELTIRSDSNLAYEGKITGEIRLVKEGTGTFLLTVPCDYTGGTLIHNGAVTYDRDFMVNALLKGTSLHLDASVRESIETDADGQVLAWRDVENRGIVFGATPQVPTATNSLPIFSEGIFEGKDCVTFTNFCARLLSNKAVKNRSIVVVHRNYSKPRPGTMPSWSCAGVYGWNRNDRGIRFSTRDRWNPEGWDTTTDYTVNGMPNTLHVPLDEVTVSACVLGANRNGVSALGDYWNNGMNRAYFGDIAEVIVFDRPLFSVEVVQLETYLMKKWGPNGTEAEETGPAPVATADHLLPTDSTLDLAAKGSLDLYGNDQTLVTLEGYGTVRNTSANPSSLKLTAEKTDLTWQVEGKVVVDLPQNGTLALDGPRILPSVGGAGRVVGGPLTVTDEIQPGGIGTVGTLTFALAPVVTGATLVCDLAEGTGDRMAVEAPFDQTGMGLRVTNPALLGTRAVEIITAASREGEFAQSNLDPKRQVILYKPTATLLWKTGGTLLILR